MSAPLIPQIYADQWRFIRGKPATFPPSPHSHGSISSAGGSVSVDSDGDTLITGLIKLKRQSAGDNSRTAAMIDAILTNDADDSLSADTIVYIMIDNQMREGLHITRDGLNVFRGQGIPQVQIGATNSNAFQVYWYENAGYLGTVGNARPLHFAGSKIYFDAPMIAGYDINFSSSAKGPIIEDRATGEPYRIFVNNGSLGIEPA